MKETFFQLCVIATMSILAVTLCINFVSASGIYGDLGDVSHGGYTGAGNSTGWVNKNQSAWDGFIGIISSDSGILSVCLSIAALAGAIYGIIKGGSTNLIAGYIFTIAFWGSWANLFFISQIGGWIPIGIIAIMSGLIVPLFIGGIIGIFSGAG